MSSLFYFYYYTSHGFPRHIALASRWLGDKSASRFRFAYARLLPPCRPRFAMARRQIRISIPLRLCTASSAMPPSLRDGSATNPHLDSASLRSASSRCVLSPYTDLQEQFCFQASLSSPVPEICAWLVISAGFPQLTDVDVE